MRACVLLLLHAFVCLCVHACLPAWARLSNWLGTCALLLLLLLLLLVLLVLLLLLLLLLVRASHLVSLTHTQAKVFVSAWQILHPAGTAEECRHALLGVLRRDPKCFQTHDHDAILVGVPEPRRACRPLAHSLAHSFAHSLALDRLLPCTLPWYAHCTLHTAHCALLHTTCTRAAIAVTLPPPTPPPSPPGWHSWR